MSDQILNPAQIETVRSFFMASAFFRKENYINPSDSLLEIMTECYCWIYESTGGDPVRLAARWVFGNEAYQNYIIEGGTLPPSTK